MRGYDVHRLTPQGATVTHEDGAVETDGPWLIVKDGAGATAAYPAHAVIEVHACQGGGDCGDTTAVR